MELGLKRVMLVGGVAQRLLGKVAIVTGAYGQLYIAQTCNFPHMCGHCDIDFNHPLELQSLQAFATPNPCCCCILVLFVLDHP